MVEGVGEAAASKYLPPTPLPDPAPKVDTTCGRFATPLSVVPAATSEDMV